jgi:hypothetical protein
MKIRAMRVEDVEAVARMDALDRDQDSEKGYRDAREHALDHLKMVPQHCYVVDDDAGSIFAAMVLHPRKEVFEIEDFHVRNIKSNREVLALLKKKLMEYLEGVENRGSLLPLRHKKTDGTNMTDAQVKSTRPHFFFHVNLCTARLEKECPELKPFLSIPWVLSV